MGRGRKAAGWVAVVVAICGAIAAVRLIRVKRAEVKLVSISIEGAVVRQDPDTNKQLPIADAEITVANGLAAGACKSDSSGFFRLTLRKGIKFGQSVTLQFRHQEYQPLDLAEAVEDKIFVVRMAPIPRQVRTQPNRPEVALANVVVRYSIKATTSVNVGSAVKTFQVVNTANVPCHGRQPCSPDGKWKATLGSASLDAEQGNVFRNARVSCIAGPCPFTRIESDAFSAGGRKISVSALGWSDTTTFLVEAEVVHPMVSDIVRESYPVKFGEALNFTLPGGAEGVSIQAEMNGVTIVFPLGPNLVLSWADCNARVNNDQTRVYRCELKPGYRFR
jgi:hypothetical protein